jgi:hypothetical protein
VKNPDVLKNGGCKTGAFKKNGFQPATILSMRILPK